MQPTFFFIIRVLKRLLFVVCLHYPSVGIARLQNQHERDWIGLDQDRHQERILHLDAIDAFHSDNSRHCWPWFHRYATTCPSNRFSNQSHYLYFVNVHCCCRCYDQYADHVSAEYD